MFWPANETPVLVRVRPWRPQTSPPNQFYFGASPFLCTKRDALTAEALFPRKALRLAGFVFNMLQEFVIDPGFTVAIMLNWRNRVVLKFSSRYFLAKYQWRGLCTSPGAVADYKQNVYVHGSVLYSSKVCLKDFICFIVHTLLGVR